MEEMRALGADWWNDSCDLNQLSDAVAQGATGATSNPVIVEAAVSADKDRWLPVVKELALANPRDDAEAITWRLIAEMGRQAAEILLPVYEETKGAKGYLSLQVNPTYNLDADKMYDQALELASLAPNIAIKVPTTESGLATAERLVGRGIPVNTTVSFSVAQAVAAAEAIERGLDAYEAAGNDPTTVHPYVTIMVGRVGDYLKRIADRERIDFSDETAFALSGVYVFKNAARLFKRQNYRSTLLAAAYRHELQWSQIIGPEVLQSLPYAWWQQFKDSDFATRDTLWEAEDAMTLEGIQAAFPDFDKIYQPDGLTESEFQTFEASAHTLTQFAQGYQTLVALVAKTMGSS